MRCWIVIPVKAPQLCKTRLSPVLGEDERQKLVATMLRQTVSAAQAVAGREQVLLLGPSRHGLAEDIPLLNDPGQGLNVALTSAQDAAIGEGVDRLLLNLPRDGIAVAPDHAGTGTNALSLPLPGAAEFRFHYGEGSFAAHEAEAERLGLPFRSVQRPGLELDIDRPEELALWRRG